MSNLIRQGDANLAAFGQLGSVVVASGATHTVTTGKPIVAFTPLTGVTGVTTIGENSNFPSMTNVPVPVGVTVFGRYTRVTSIDGPTIVYFG